MFGTDIYECFKFQPIVAAAAVLIVVYVFSMILVNDDGLMAGAS